MLASGNSDVTVCARNLLSTVQRDIPFARTKGIDPDVFDMPFDEAEDYMDEAARNVLGAYEDRIDVETVGLEFGEEDDGGDITLAVRVIESSLDVDADDEEYYEEA